MSEQVSWQFRAANKFALVVILDSFQRLRVGFDGFLETEKRMDAVFACILCDTQLSESTSVTSLGYMIRYPAFGRLIALVWYSD